MFGKCSTEGCDEMATGRLLGNKCPFHDAVAAARELPAGDFDRLREVLTYTPPWSDEERRARRVRSALSQIKWQARDLKRGRKRAIAAGATKGQIAEAVRAGRADA